MPQSSIAENNKRIAKNTIFLYIRMFFIMAIALFTSRVILKTLGVEDYGIYNVVGGVVAMMGVVDSALNMATSRYLTYNLGKNDSKELHKTFCISLTIYICICIVFFILAETIGIWFVNTQLNIPQSRMVAANWGFQFTVLSLICSFLQNPYTSSVIAHERMDFYAYVSIVAQILKLVIVYCLFVVPFDRLIVYGGLYFLVSLLTLLVNRYYCIRKFEECHFVLYKDKTMFKEILSYSGWSFFGALAGIARGQGLNILLNIFFSPVVNAARGIASQVDSASGSFFGGFMTAVRPQITKYYAQGDYENMNILIFRSSKFSFYLLWLVALPIIIECPIIINLWLGQTPEYVIPFTRIIILTSAVESFSSPIMTLSHATGKIKMYQFVVGMINILNIPVSYVVLKMGYPPISVFFVAFIASVIAMIVRLYITKRLVPEFPLGSFYYKVLLISLFVAVISSLLPLVLYYSCEQSVLNAFIICTLAVISTTTSAYLFGLNNKERNYLNQLVKTKLLHR